LGNMTKDEVRNIAGEIHLPLVEKEESQDFYSGNYKELLDVADQPGDIVDRRGNVLGYHKGIWNYTIGQRKGLGIAFKEPLYVLEIDNENNQVIAGTHDEVMATSFYVDDLNWIAIEKLDEPLELDVKIRSANRATSALIEPVGDGKVKVIFRNPNDGITPGQSAVFYQDDIVIGGGIIKEVAK
jgi:tRNA-specific 2-thiouridylase